MSKAYSLLRELRRRKVFRGAAIYLLAGWVVLQVADVIAEPAGLPAWTLRVLLYLAVIGFPLALFFGWRYELGEHGIVRTQPESANVGDGHAALGFRDYVSIGVFVFVSAAVAWQVIPSLIEQQTRIDVAGPRLIAIPNSIVVIPFTEISADSNGGYLAAGISDTVTHVLGQVGGLVVTARTSARAFRNSTAKVIDIARELRVAYILEGTVQRAGNRMRITASLVDSQSETEMWSRQFDREIDDIFAVQDEIADEVVIALSKSIDLGDEKLGEHYRPNLDSFRELTLGKEARESGSVAGILAAEEHFKRAVELDPDYSLAYVALAGIYERRQDINRAERPAKMRPLLEKALELDPLSADAYSLLGLVLWREGKNEEVEPILQKALSLNANLVDAHTAYTTWLMILGRHDESLAQARIALKLDPKSREVLKLMAQATWNVARSEEAISYGKRLVREFPDNPDGYEFLSRAYLQMGKPGDGMRYTQALYAMDPDSRSGLSGVCGMWFQLWDFAASDRCYEDYLSRWPDDLEIRKQLALSRGQMDEAIRLAREHAEAEPNRNYRQVQYAFFLELDHRFEDVSEVLTAHFPHLLDDEPVINSFTTWPGIMLAHALIKTGDAGRGLLLLAAVETAVERMRKLQGSGLVAGYEEVQIHAIRGDNDRALAELEAVIDSGWVFFSYSLVVDSKLDDMRTDPRYQPLEDRLRSNIAEQRVWYEEHKDDPLYWTRRSGSANENK